MMFLPKIYEPKDVVQMILAAAKTQTRRLVKEGEFSVGFPVTFEKPDNGIESVMYWGKRPLKHIDDSTARIKWQVGRDYSVQLGRGKRGVYGCTCGACYNWVQAPLPEDLAWGCPYEYLKPLRIIITKIRREHLLDITEEDAKKEGFKDKQEFITAFMNVNSLADACKVFENPEVWVLEFEVKK